MRNAVGLGSAIGIVFALVVMPDASKAADEKPATPETIAKYHDIFTKLEKEYATIRGKGVSKQKRFLEEKPRWSLTVNPFEFARIPNMIRVDHLGAEMIGFHDEVVHKTDKGIVGYNATKFFVVTGPNANGIYTLKFTEGLTKKNMRQPSGNIFDVPDCPFSADGWKLAEIIADPLWKVYEPTEIECDGRKLIRLRLGRGPELVIVETATKGSGAYCLRVLLDPELNHAIRGWSRVRTSRTLKDLLQYHSVIIDYQKNPKGPPIPKSLTEEWFAWDEKAPKQRLGGGEVVSALMIGRTNVTIDNFDFIAKPAEHFELKAFGLPDLLPELPKPGVPPVPNPPRRR